MIDPKSLYPLIRKRVLVTTNRGGNVRKFKAHLLWIRENRIVFTPLGAGGRMTRQLKWIAAVEPLENEIITKINPASLRLATDRKVIVTYMNNNRASRGFGKLIRVDSERLYQSTPSAKEIRAIPLSLILQVEVIA